MKKRMDIDNNANTNKEFKTMHLSNIDEQNQQTTS